LASDPELSPTRRFLYGAVGAIAPEVVRWVKIAQTQTQFAFPTDWRFYVAIFVVFALIAGLYTTLWRDNSPIKCFMLGASFPAFVASIVNTPPAAPG
jgi:hypothetical protein